MSNFDCGAYFSCLTAFRLSENDRNMEAIHVCMKSTFAKSSGSKTMIDLISFGLAVLTHLLHMRKYFDLSLAQYHGRMYVSHLYHLYCSKQVGRLHHRLCGYFT